MRVLYLVVSKVYGRVDPKVDLKVASKDRNSVESMAQ